MDVKNVERSRHDGVRGEFVSLCSASGIFGAQVKYMGT